MNTLNLNGFSSRLFRRRSGADVRHLRAKAQKQDELAAVVARFIPANLFTNPTGKRDRVFTPWGYFCAFLGQVLQRDSSCQDAVRRVQTMYLEQGETATIDDAPAVTAMPVNASRRMFCERLPRDWPVVCNAYTQGGSLAGARI